MVLNWSNSAFVVASGRSVSIRMSTWRSTKRYGLSYVKVGRLVRYRLADVEAFEISRLQEITANDN